MGNSLFHLLLNKQKEKSNVASQTVSNNIQSSLNCIFGRYVEKWLERLSDENYLNVTSSKPSYKT